MTSSMDKGNKTPIKKSLKDTSQYLQERLDLDTNYDICCRQYKLGNRDIHFYFVNGLSDDSQIIQVLRNVSLVEKPLSNIGSFRQLLERSLSHNQVERVDNYDEAVDELLSGLMLVFGDSWGEALVVDTRSYPGREPEEPDTERVIRGSRDGFTENIIYNTALVRRRIRDERLRMEMTQVGERSKTDICVSYIKDIASPFLLNELKHKLSQIDIDGIPMAEKTIEEFVIEQGYNPFPKVRFTERPDVAAAQLFEGHILMMVDTSPTIMIIPTTYFHHFQHAEEFRRAPTSGIYIRWIRFLGIFASIFLLPIWILFVIKPDLIPAGLEFIGPEDDYEIAVFWQFMIAEAGIDLMRLAAIHTPTPLATAMGLIAAILVGEIAIEMGLFVPEVILYIAVAAVGMFATPSYELTTANRLVRLFLLLAVYLFQVPGLMVGSTLFIVFLVMTRSLKIPYFWPLIPFNLKAFLSIVLRFTSELSNTRPSIVHPRDTNKQSK